MRLGAWCRCTILERYRHRGEAVIEVSRRLSKDMCSGKAYSDDDRRVCRDLGWDGDVHLHVGRVGAKAGHLRESSKGRAGRRQQGGCGGESLHGCSG